MGSAASLRAGTLLAVLLLVFPLSVSEGYQVGWSRREDCQDSRQLSLWDTGGNALLARTSFRWAKAWEHRDMPVAGSSVGGSGGPGPLTGAVLLGVRDPEGEQGEKGVGLMEDEEPGPCCCGGREGGRRRWGLNTCDSAAPSPFSSFQPTTRICLKLSPALSLLFSFLLSDLFDWENKSLAYCSRPGPKRN